MLQIGQWQYIFFTCYGLFYAVLSNFMQFVPLSIITPSPPFSLSPTTLQGPTSFSQNSVSWIKALIPWILPEAKAKVNFKIKF